MGAVIGAGGRKLGLMDYMAMYKFICTCVEREGGREEREVITLIYFVFWLKGDEGEREEGIGFVFWFGRIFDCA